MANIWENAVITNKGVELQAKILAGGEITITSVKVGAGSVPVSQLNEQLAVSNIKQTAKIQKLEHDGSTVVIPVHLTNEGVSTAYDLRQVGFYATDPEEGEILYAIAQNTVARHIPSETESPGYRLHWRFNFTISNNVNLNAVVDPAGVALYKDVANLIKVENLDFQVTGTHQEGVTITRSVSLAGYKAVGIVGFGTGINEFLIQSINVNQTSQMLSAEIYHKDTTEDNPTATFHFTVAVLYVKVL